VSGRGWKAPGTRAGSRKNPGLATSWDAKMAVKAEAKLFREQKDAAKDAHKAKLSARPPLNLSLTSGCMGVCTTYKRPQSRDKVA